MKDHLSEEQIAKCVVGVATVEERQHLLECAECAMEVTGFGDAVSALRHTIRRRVDAHADLQPLPAASLGPSFAGMRELGWALATAAVLLLGIVPVLTSTKPEVEIASTGFPPAQSNPDDLMNAINVHLSRTIPAPMEPMMSLIASDESTTE